MAELIGFAEDIAAAGIIMPELKTLIDRLAVDPQVGDLMVGTGGARKAQMTGLGKGRSGEFRVISYYAGDGLPVFLITVFSKGEHADLSAAERVEIKRELESLASDYRKARRKWARWQRRS